METERAVPVERLSIQTTGDDRQATVVAVGEIDLAVADRLWHELDRELTAGRTVVLDCSGVDFLDSMGLRALIKATQKADKVGARFHLAAPSATVHRILDLAGVADVFIIHTIHTESASCSANERIR
jgi:anti-anti-sigma factor